MVGLFPRTSSWRLLLPKGYVERRGDPHCPLFGGRAFSSRPSQRSGTLALTRPATGGTPIYAGLVGYVGGSRKPWMPTTEESPGRFPSSNGRLRPLAKAAYARNFPPISAASETRKVRAP